MTDQPRPTEHAEQQRCNDPYPHAYTSARDEQRLCELAAGHPNRGVDDHRWGDHVWRALRQHAPSGEPWEEAKWRQRSLTVLELAQENTSLRAHNMEMRGEGVAMEVENERLKQEAIERAIFASDQVEVIDGLRAELAQALRFREMQDIALRNHTEQISVLVQQRDLYLAELQKARVVVDAAKLERKQVAKLADAELRVMEYKRRATNCNDQLDRALQRRDLYLAELQKARGVVSAFRQYDALLKAWGQRLDEGNQHVGDDPELDTAYEAILRALAE